MKRIISDCYNRDGSSDGEKSDEDNDVSMNCRLDSKDDRQLNPNDVNLRPLSTPTTILPLKSNILTSDSIDPYRDEKLGVKYTKDKDEARLVSNPVLTCSNEPKPSLDKKKLLKPLDLTLPSNWLESEHGKSKWKKDSNSGFFNKPLEPSDDFHWSSSSSISTDTLNNPPQCPSIPSSHDKASMMMVPRQIRSSKPNMITDEELASKNAQMLLHRRHNLNSPLDPSFPTYK